MEFVLTAPPLPVWNLQGSTAGNPSYFGGSSGESYFKLGLPSNTNSVTLSLCGSATNFDTVMFVTKACFGNGLTNNDVVCFDSQPCSLPLRFFLTRLP